MESGQADEDDKTRERESERERERERERLNKEEKQADSCSHLASRTSLFLSQPAQLHLLSSSPGLSQPWQ